MNGEATALAVFSPSLSFPSLDEAISGLKAIATTQGFTLLENTGPYNAQYVGRGMASFRCATKDCEFFITLRKVIRQKINDQVAGPDGQPPPESLTVEKWSIHTINEAHKPVCRFRKFNRGNGEPSVIQKQSIGVTDKHDGSESNTDIPVNGIEEDDDDDNHGEGSSTGIYRRSSDSEYDDTRRHVPHRAPKRKSQRNLRSANLKSPAKRRSARTNGHDETVEIPANYLSTNGYHNSFQPFAFPFMPTYEQTTDYWSKRPTQEHEGEEEIDELDEILDSNDEGDLSGIENFEMPYIRSPSLGVPMDSVNTPLDPPNLSTAQPTSPNIPNMPFAAAREHVQHDAVPPTPASQPVESRSPLLSSLLDELIASATAENVDTSGLPNFDAALALDQVARLTTTTHDSNVASAHRSAKTTESITLISQLTQLARTQASQPGSRAHSPVAAISPAALINDGARVSYGRKSIPTAQTESMQPNGHFDAGQFDAFMAAASTSDSSSDERLPDITAASFKQNHSLPDTASVNPTMINGGPQPVSPKPPPKKVAKQPTETRISPRKDKGKARDMGPDYFATAVELGAIPDANGDFNIYQIFASVGAADAAIMSNGEKAGMPMIVDWGKCLNHPDYPSPWYRCASLCGYELHLSDDARSNWRVVHVEGAHKKSCRPMPAASKAGPAKKKKPPARNSYIPPTQPSFVPISSRPVVRRARSSSRSSSPAIEVVASASQLAKHNGRTSSVGGSSPRVDKLNGSSSQPIMLEEESASDADRAKAPQLKSEVPPSPTTTSRYIDARHSRPTKPGGRRSHRAARQRYAYVQNTFFATADDEQRSPSPPAPDLSPPSPVSGARTTRSGGVFAAEVPQKPKRLRRKDGSLASSPPKKTTSPVKTEFRSRTDSTGRTFIDLDTSSEDGDAVYKPDDTIPDPPKASRHRVRPRKSSKRGPSPPPLDSSLDMALDLPPPIVVPPSKTKTVVEAPRLRKRKRSNSFSLKVSILQGSAALTSIGFPRSLCRLLSQGGYSLVSHLMQEGLAGTPDDFEEFGRYFDTAFLEDALSRSAETHLSTPAGRTANGDWKRSLIRTYTRKVILDVRVRAMIIFEANAEMGDGSEINDSDPAGEQEGSDSPLSTLADDVSLSASPVKAVRSVTEDAIDAVDVVIARPSVEVEAPAASQLPILRSRTSPIQEEQVADSEEEREAGMQIDVDDTVRDVFLQPEERASTPIEPDEQPVAEDEAITLDQHSPIVDAGELVDTVATVALAEESPPAAPQERASSVADSTTEPPVVDATPVANGVGVDAVPLSSDTDDSVAEAMIHELVSTPKLPKHAKQAVNEVVQTTRSVEDVAEPDTATSLPGTATSMASATSTQGPIIASILKTSLSATHTSGPPIATSSASSAAPAKIPRVYPSMLLPDTPSLGPSTPSASSSPKPSGPRITLARPTRPVRPVNVTPAAHPLYTSQEQAAKATMWERIAAAKARAAADALQKVDEQVKVNGVDGGTSKDDQAVSIIEDAVTAAPSEGVAHINGHSKNHALSNGHTHDDEAESSRDVSPVSVPVSITPRPRKKLRPSWAKPSKGEKRVTMNGDEGSQL